MKKIKLTGREIATLRAIDFSIGTKGSEIAEHTRICMEDLADILNGLMEGGFVETEPASHSVSLAELPATHFEVNPSYALDLKEAMTKRY